MICADEAEPPPARRMLPPQFVTERLVAVFLFVSPWLFSYAQENARIGILISSAAVAVTAISAILAYANWKEWLFCLEPG